jgi:hypothetical protein
LLRLRQPSDWRRHKYLPSRGGRHGNYELSDIAVAFTLKRLVDLGLNPSKAVGMAHAAGPSVLYHALFSPAAWDPRGPSGVDKLFLTAYESDEWNGEVSIISSTTVRELYNYGIALSNGEFRLSTSHRTDVASRRRPDALRPASQSKPGLRKPGLCFPGNDGAGPENRTTIS